MLGNCEKMNNQIDVQKGGCLNTKINNMGSAGSGRVLDDQKIAEIAQEHQQKQQNQELLRCPRCDSTNTKFCYYNNYSLSQPRHFCKACKRYWTRGGTLRNVPVGGGCRKNKRVKRPSNSSSSSSLTNSNLIDANSANSASSNGHVSPLFYGSDINFPFSRYDFQIPPQINGIGLGFSPSSSGLIHNMNGNGGFSTVPASKQIFQDLISSNPLLSNYTSSSPTISSLFGSSLQIKGANNFQTLLPSYDHQNDLQMKEVKMELEGQNSSIDHHSSAPSQNHMDQTMGSSSDPVLWGGGVNNLGAWLDPSYNIGSSVPSLI